MSQPFTLTRRTTLAGAAALAAGTALPAIAQDNKRIVVGTWGGDYSRLLAKNIETPLLVPKGWDVVKDEANAPPRRAKMMAEKALRRGTSDVQGLSANDMYEVNEQGMAEQLDYSKMPNAANLIPARVTGLLAAGLAPAVGGSPRHALRMLRRDGGKHPSPNAGRCEAAFAGSLAVQLGGQNVYHGRTEQRGLLGDGGPPDAADIARAVRLSRLVSTAAAVLAAVIAHILRRGRKL